MFAFSFTTTPTASSTEKPVKGYAPQLRTSTSRPLLLAASGLFTVALFLLDAQALQAQHLGTSFYEFAFYILGLLATLLYVSFVCKGRPAASSDDVAEVTKAKGVSAAEAARASLRKVCDGLRRLCEMIQCPRPAEESPAEEKPPVPFWGLVVVAVLLNLITAALVVTAFTAVPEAETLERMSFLDAPFRCQGQGQDQDSHHKMSRNWTWLVAAFTLSSGLCVVHPLQSGLVLGF